MSSKRDYYEVLGVGKNATADELKSAYRNLAKKFHPDVNKDKGSEDKFKEANEAYEILSDPQKRQAYDQYGHAGVGAGGPGGFGGGGFEGFGGGDFGDIFGDLFENVFSGGGRSRGGARARSNRGEDLQVRLTITLHDALMGTQKSIKVPRTQTCQKCSGSGARKGTSAKTCPQCKGTGSIHFRQGFFSLSQTCSRCQGAGQVIENPCDQCGGHGKVKNNEPIAVRIPPGVQEGTALRVSGSGDSGSFGGPSGDLYVVIHFEADPRFERRDDDLLLDQKISITEAALGSEVEVPALDGKVTLRIPPGTQAGTTFRVKQRGIPHLNGRGRGDMLVRIVVEVPTSLNAQQKELLREFAKTLGEDMVSKDDDSFLKKVFGK